MSGPQIIEDIRNQTQTQLEEIQNQAESDMKKRRELTEGNVAELVSKADCTIAEEQQRVRARVDRQLEQEERRIHLVLQDRVLQAVRRLVEADLSRLRDSPDYFGLLQEWTLEAAVGLGYGNSSEGNSQKVPGARIRCCKEDHTQLECRIADIQELFLTLSGHSIRLEMDDQSLPAASAGIVLVDEEGRTAYSNTSSDRFRRVTPAIHKMVIEKIFPGRTE